MGERKTGFMESMKEYPPTLTKDQVAEILGISTRKVDDLFYKGRIKTFIIDPDSKKKQARVNKSDLADYMMLQGDE